MSEFYVKFSGIRDTGEKLDGLAVELEKCADSVRHVSNRLDGEQWEIVCAKLQRMQDRFLQEGRTARNCGNVLKEIVLTYETTEKNLTGEVGLPTLSMKESTQRGESILEKFFNSIKNWIASVKEYYANRPNPYTVEPYEVDNIVFDTDGEKGKYGGDQGALMYRDTEQKQWIYNNILKKNIPDLELSSDELDEFYSNMNNTGCAYVALLNTVFTHFQGREEEFEKTFGYPMFDKNGNLNYDIMFADIYTTKHSDGKTFKGLTPKEGEELIEGYLKNHGVKCDAKVTNSVSPKNIDTLLYEGKQVIIHYYCGNIYPVGSEKGHTITAHDMVITGVTEDGKYIVSSWGDKYYLDPNEKLNTVKGKTHFSYSIVTYS
ncbi:hypothetical protein [Oribacterium sp. FC2011]|uniref:hypothetical protein n=1 Tax=Oribacterium sp. FC2011 TaxID=1408311 RepID=UPI0004E124F6|nr:hypothetical protein [Oribacterium sp. FC2011]